MSVYIVTYDLHKVGQNYTCITDKLKGYGTHWHIQGSVWIIETAQSAVEVRDYLLPCLDNNDKLIVAHLSGEAAWSGYSDDGNRWLKDCLERVAH
ncbi:MAG: hypothetical protein BGO06_22310 [Shinella sp. 65-6]|nr:MAG: hypothetical protein BGO06_22310 [Shinella sp. 65-6]